VSIIATPNVWMVIYDGQRAHNALRTTRHGVTKTLFYDHVAAHKYAQRMNEHFKTDKVSVVKFGAVEHNALDPSAAEAATLLPPIFDILGGRSHSPRKDR
jgi:hypothetical protein